jgi:hypothetical protein
MRFQERGFLILYCRSEKMKCQCFGIWLIVTVVAASALGTQSFAAVNLLANPGFEDGGGSYNGWFVFADSGARISTSATDNIFRSGLAASKIYGEFTACPGQVFDVGVVGQAFTPTPGMKYEFTGYSYMSSDDPIPGMSTCLGNRLLAQIAFFDAVTEGTVIATSEVIVGDFETPTDQWIPFSVRSAPTPAGALRVEALFLFLQPGCDTGAVFVDDVSFCELPTVVQPNILVNPSFDTNLNGWNTFGNAFFEGRTFGRRTPTGAAKLFGAFAAAGDASVITQTFLATPGSAWQLDLYAMTTCVEDPVTGINDNIGIARVLFLDASGAEIGANEMVILDNDSPLGSWNKKTMFATNAPAATDSVKLLILFVQPTDPLLGGAMFIDDVGLQELNPVAVSLPTTPSGMKLHQNVPNPFTPNTRIDFVLTQQEAVNISVYDVAGRRVATLFQGQLGPGPHSVTWDGRTAGGASAAAGVYRYVLKTSTGQLSRSMMMLK